MRPNGGELVGLRGCDGAGSSGQSISLNEKGGGACSWVGKEGLGTSTLCWMAVERQR